MKKNVPSTRCILLLTATLLCFFSLFTSCQKSGEKETDPAPAPTNRDISLLTTSAVPGELVLAQANFTPEKDTATILVGTKTVVAVKVDSNRIAFVMPVLPANSTASIRYDKMGLTKQVSITINDYIPITQPDDVYNQLMTELDKTQQLFASYENDTIIQLDAQYRQILDYVKQRFATQYTTMTNAQRLEVAYGIRSNMINAQDFRVETQNVLFVARTQGDPGDPGDVCRTVIGRILGTSGSAYIKMLRGGALTATGAAMIALGDPITKAAGVVTAGLGVALFIRGANEYIQAHSYDNVLNEMLGVRQAGFESLRTADNPIELLNNTETSVLFKGLFRTINQADGSSSNLLLAEAFKEKARLVEVKAVAEKAYADVKLFLLGNAPAFPTTTPKYATTSVARMISLQGAKLTLSNVSNPAISVSFTKEDAGLKIKPASATLTQETPFTMDLTYTNPNTGTVVVDKINAIFKLKEPSSMAIVSGNNQVGKASSALAASLVVVVKDQSGQPMPNVTVGWTVTSGGGQLNSATSTTNANGQANCSWTLGASGLQTVSATVKKANGSLVSGAPQTFTANIDCDPAFSSAPQINGISFGCSSSNEIKIDVAFTAGGAGILVGSGSGSCDPAMTCYPIRLYFKNPGATDWMIAYNGYSAGLLSGTVNSGVAEIRIYKSCIAGKTAEESLASYYTGYQWKVELMNKCNQRSNAITF